MKRHMGEKDAAEAAEYLRRAADQNHPWARCLLGKLCLTGSGIPKDEEATRNCFRMADSYGHPHVDVLERQKLPFTVSRLLCHMSYIFQHNAAAVTAQPRLHIDCKQMQELQKLRIALRPSARQPRRRTNPVPGRHDHEGVVRFLALHKTQMRILKSVPALNNYRFFRDTPSFYC